jgi:hypothetical protein
MVGIGFLLLDREFEDQVIKFKSYDKDKLLEEILFFKFKFDCGKFKCLHCDKILASKQNLDYHLESGICVRPKYFKCNNCDKIFSTNQRLKYHIKNNVCKNEASLEINKKIQNKPIEDELVKNNAEQDNQKQKTITKNIDGYVYLLQITDTNTNEHFYKIGKTNRSDPFSRMGEYTPGYKMLFIKYSTNPTATENKFIDILKKDDQIEKYEYGREYFISKTQEYIFNLLIPIN